MLDLTTLTIPLITCHVILLVWLHFLGDFALHINQMAINKGSSLKWLTIHVAAYSASFLIFFGWQFALLNFVLHWLTDFVTSKISGHYNKSGNMRMFFATIGFDQAIHMTCLYVTYVVLFI